MPSGRNTMEEFEARQKKRKRKQIGRRVMMGVWALSFAFLVYIGIQVALVLSPNVRRELAIMATMTDSVTARGFVALESETVTYDGGVLFFTVDSGERVSQGTPVAEIYSSTTAAETRMELEATKNELDNLEVALKTSTNNVDTENYIRQLNKGVVGLIDMIDTKDWSGLSTALGEVTLAANRMQVATGEADLDAYHRQLEAQRDRLAAAAVAQAELLAPTSGFFVQASGKDRVPMTYEALAEASAGQLAAQLEDTPQYYGSDVAGYMISDYKWSFFALVTAEEAERFRVGDKSLSISFAELGSTQLPVEVKAVEVDEAAGIAKVELYCEYIQPEILKMHDQNIEIIFSTQKGIRIPIEALRVIEGEKYVYVDFGNIANLCKVDIILENEYYMLVSATYAKGRNEVRLYDSVIVDSGGVELEDGKSI